MSWLSRLFRRKPAPAPVELDLHQQLAVLTLARFGPCGFSRLYDEVSAIRRTTEAELVNALLKLDAAAIIERESDPKTAQRLRRYTLTRRGRRLTRYIPREPRSAIEFYV